MSVLKGHIESHLVPVAPQVTMSTENILPASKHFLKGDTTPVENHFPEGRQDWD